LTGLLPERLQVEQGELELDGEIIALSRGESIAAWRGRRVGMIFQDPLASLNPVLSCGRQVEEPLRLHTQLSQTERQGRVIETFLEMGFDDPWRIYRAFPGELSGGQCQRVMLAMAVIMRPTMLLADEPTASLDANSGKIVLELLSRLKSAQETAVLLIAHDLDRVQPYIDRTLWIRDGRLQFTPGRNAVGTSEKFASVPRLAVPPLLSVRFVSKTFLRRNLLARTVERVVVFSDVSLDLYPGEVVGVVGESGSGKTTLGRCIAGLLAHDQGEIRFEGRLVDPRNPGAGGGIQMVYQSPFASLNPLMRIGEAIAEGLRVRGVPPGQRREQVLDLLDKVGLSRKYYSHFPRELSGGERQRVAIARALARQPRLLVADEPTASLDELTGAQVLDLLKGLTRTLDLSLLLISHDRRAIARVCDRVVALWGGKAVETEAEMEEAPITREVD
jgi:peptide/nickel transport system ATP-binding protein